MKRIKYYKAERQAAHERDGGRCVRCGTVTGAPPHHAIKGSDRYRGVDWRHRDFVVTLCGPFESNCHALVEGWNRRRVIEFLKSKNYNGRFNRLIAQLEEWYPI